MSLQLLVFRGAPHPLALPPLWLEMAARRGHISFKGKARGGGLGVRRKSHLLRKTLKKNINGVTISWMGRVLGQAETCQSRIHAV